MTSPRPATTHKVEAVVRPATVPRAWKMVPAPRKPTPVMTPAAMRTSVSGFPPLPSTRSVARVIIIAEATQTRIFVRNPAGF